MNRSLLPLLLCSALSLLHLPSRAADDLPEIIKIRGRTVTVKVPAGFDRVTLQVLKKRASASLRRAEASGNDWKTVGVEYPRGSETLLQFRLARLTPRRHLQVLGYKDDELPGSLLTGITNFLGQPLTGDGAGGTATPGAPGPEANGAMFASDARSAGETRTVEEADIWKVRGDRLYFFNERRGLQVFELKNPDEPVLLGTLRMPGVGEDMYLLDDAHVVLLKKAWDFFWFDFRLSPVIARGTPILFAGDAASSPVTTSSAMTLAADAVTVRAAEANLLPQQTSRNPREIVVVNVAGGEPKIVGRESFEGSVLESRLVGRVLYLATHVYRETDENVASESGAELTAYDLHDVAQPVRRDRIRLGGWANAVAATDRFFFVAKSGVSDGTQIDVVDISDAHGAMEKRGAVPVQGYVQDKFKMHLSGEVLTVVSARWGGANGGRPVTELATFSLSNPDAPARLGELQLAPGETVRATRFDQNRGYVVTFEQIDPLWVVDLSDPSAPKVLGHAEAPGFSTYIEPLGDRLVTIGLVNWRPAVSLFDVADSAKPRLLSQIVFGERDDGQWAYSEATWNEKAFSVLADEGLILFPVSIHDTKGHRSGVQLVDLRPDKVVKRGTVEDAFNPRRATVHGNRIVAISPTHLTSINAENRDAPEVTAKVEIAWSVDRLFVVGDHLVQLGSDWDGNSSRATLTVTPVASPDETLATLDLPALPVASATLRDQTLYVLLGRSHANYVYLFGATADATNDDGEGETESDATLLTFDLSTLPAIQLTGSVSVTAPELVDSYWHDALPHWIDETTLAFSVGKYGRLWLKPFWYDPPKYVASASEHLTSIIRVDPEPYWGLRYLYGLSQVVLAFNVADSKSPKFASSVEIGAEKPWNVAPPVAAGKGRLYASYQIYGKVLREDQWDYRKNNERAAYLDEALDPETNRHFLQIIDYSNPAQPFLEEAAPNLPGRLESVTRGGRVLFTRGPKYNAETGAPLDEQALHASALDGTAVHLLDQFSVRDDYRDIVRYRNNVVFVLHGEPAHIWRPSPPSEDNALRFSPIWWGGSYEKNPNKSRLAAWELGEEGKFAKLDELELEHETSFHCYGQLGVTFAQANQPGFLDLSNATDLRLIGSGQFEGISALYDRADGSLQRGLWIPTGYYGVEPIPFFVE